MLGFKASKHRLTLLLGVNAAGDFKLKLILIYHPLNSGALKNQAKCTLPILYKWRDKAWMTAYLFTTQLTDYFEATIEVYCSGKKDFFQNITVIVKAPSHSRALMEMYNEGHGVSCLIINIHSAAHGSGMISSHIIQEIHFVSL